MNHNFVKSVKLGLFTALYASVCIPVGYEIYANISRTFALLLLLAGAVFIGIRFAKLPLKEAFIGFVYSVILTVGFSLVTSLVIHRLSVKFIDSISGYISISLDLTFDFYIKTAAISLVIIALPILKLVLDKFRQNSEATKNYIDNAFDEDKE